MKRRQIMFEDWQAEMLDEFSKKHRQSAFVRQCVSSLVAGGKCTLDSCEGRELIDFAAHKKWEKRRVR